MHWWCPFKLIHGASGHPWLLGVETAEMSPLCSWLIALAPWICKSRAASISRSIWAWLFLLQFLGPPRTKWYREWRSCLALITIFPWQTFGWCLSNTRFPSINARLIVGVASTAKVLEFNFRLERVFKITIYIRLIYTVNEIGDRSGNYLERIYYAAH